MVGLIPKNNISINQKKKKMTLASDGALQEIKDVVHMETFNFEEDTKGLDKVM